MIASADMAMWLKVVILAMVQGLTEFLPISSSGHLVLSQTFLGIDEAGVQLELILHIGTLLAVVLYYRRDLLDIATGFARFTGGGRGDGDISAFRMVLFLIAGTIPAVIGALTFGDAVESAFSDPRLVCVFLVVTGFLLLSTLLLRRRDRRVGPVDAVVMGVFQMAALLPGISRSGSTIAGGLYRGVRPDDAARFSFLLSIPAILGASVFKAKDLTDGFSGASALLHLGGLLVSFLFGYLSIGVLLRIVRRGRFGFFGVYCVVVGVGGWIALSLR